MVASGCVPGSGQAPVRCLARFPGRLRRAGRPWHGPPAMPPADPRADQDDRTRTRLLRAAERLIITEGVTALTVRRIATEAESNSALIRYYFGTTDGLLAELARLNAAPMVAEIERRLAHARTLDQILEAHLRPLWREAAFSPGERALVVLDEILRHGDAALRQRLFDWFAPPVAAATTALAACLPGLDPATIAWRLRFLSAAALDIPSRASSRVLTGAAADPAGEAARFRQMMAFALGAMTGPAPG